MSAPIQKLLKVEDCGDPEITTIAFLIAALDDLGDDREARSRCLGYVAQRERDMAAKDLLSP